MRPLQALDNIHPSITLIDKDTARLAAAHTAAEVDTARLAAAHTARLVDTVEPLAHTVPPGQDREHTALARLADTAELPLAHTVLPLDTVEPPLVHTALHTAAAHSLSLPGADILAVQKPVVPHNHSSPEYWPSAH
jgi:hypothetical protein